MIYYLDSNICIYFLNRKHSEVVDRILNSSPSDLAIPSVVAAELLFGAEKSQQSNSNRIKLNEFLSAFPIIPFDHEAARHHAKIRYECQKHLPGPSDLMIGAIVRSRGGILVTHNLREFQRIPQLRCESWVEETP